MRLHFALFRLESSQLRRTQNFHSQATHRHTCGTPHLRFALCGKHTNTVSFHTEKRCARSFEGNWGAKTYEPCCCTQNLRLQSSRSTLLQRLESYGARNEIHKMSEYSFARSTVDLQLSRRENHISRQPKHRDRHRAMCPTGPSRRFIFTLYTIAKKSERRLHRTNREGAK